MSFITDLLTGNIKVSGSMNFLEIIGMEIRINLHVMN